MVAKQVKDAKRKSASASAGKPGASRRLKTSARTVAPVKKAPAVTKKSKSNKQPSKQPERTSRSKASRSGSAKLPSSRQGKESASASGQGTVSIRMYRGLLGDFFLLKHAVGENVFRMLIDCGVLQCIGTKQAKPVTSLGRNRIIAGIKDLVRDSGGKLDLVVATHEHYDHLSGFILAHDEFRSLRISRVWIAWTEDRKDKLANSYRNRKRQALTALSALAKSSAFAATEEMKTVSNLLQFYGGIDGIQRGAMGAAKSVRADKLSGNASCEAVLEWLMGKAEVGNVSYLKPGQVLHWGLNDAFRAYVLGPPRDDEKLRKLNPSKGSQREVYLARSDDVETVSGLAAVHADSAGKAQVEDQPFVRLHWRPYDGKSKKRAKSLRDPIVKLYAGSDSAKYRRIDLEWLGSAEDLALKIDGDVNNTSLALALELADKKVLLFPGDAQVGNWLSWGDQTYPADDAKDGPRVRIEDLLARTVFYKVGHHASHNATLRERGLELMTDPRLCAMIPVVEKTAREQKTKTSPAGWAMPYGDLNTRLIQRTGGRLLRGDGDIAEERSKFKESIFNLVYGEIYSSNDPLWVELSL
jgi:hypothetical protein